MPDIVVVGAGGHAVSLTETLMATGYQVVAYTGDSAGSTLLGRPILTDVPSSHVEAGGSVAVAIGDNWTRERVWHHLATRIPLTRLPVIVHPSASVSPLAQLGAGTVVLQGAIVGSGARVGIGCLINSGSILEHECVMGDFSSLAPGAVTGGRVRIGPRAAVSIGAIVKHGISIGSDSVVGAASYVHSDVPTGVVSYGAPARTVRERAPGDAYL